MYTSRYCLFIISISIISLLYLPVFAIASSRYNKHNILGNANTSEYNADYNNSLRIIYISFYKPLSNISNPVITSSQPLSTIMKADDSPFQRIKLPFPLNFFGEDIYYLYANPNGALHMNEIQPCGGFAGFGNDCNFFNSYYGTIAGFLIDLDPSRKSIVNGSDIIGGNITYNNYNNKQISVDYISINAWGNRSLTYTFTINVFSDSSIRLDYINIKNVQDGISAVRVPSPNPYDYYADITANQIEIGLNDWKSKVEGIYPLINQVYDGNTFIVCPIAATTWCIEPSVIYASNSDDHILTLSPALISCLDDVQFSIELTSYATKKNISDKISCEVPLENSNLLCNLTSWLNEVREFDHGEYQLLVYWKPIHERNIYEKLEIPSINVELFNQTFIDPSNSEVCEVNHLYPTCSTAIDSCEICHGNFTCLDLPCNNGTEFYPYKHPICRGNDSCATNLIYNTNVFKNESVCCTVDQTDCNGVCFGTATITYDTQGSLLCCLSGIVDKNGACCGSGKVDCTGVCDGKVEPDGCGVCNGGNARGDNCKDSALLYTPNGDLVPVINLREKSWEVLTITIENISNETISATVLSSSASNNHQDLGPNISYINGTIIIPQNQSKGLIVNISYEGILSGKQYDWEVKRIVIEHSQVNKSDPFLRDRIYSRTFDIYPASKNCSIVSSQPLCMSLPTCNYCFKSNDFRLLSEVEGSYDSKSITRRLYTGVLPNTIVNDDSMNIPGVCIDGNSTDICNSIISAAVSLQDSFKYNYLWITTVILIMVMRNQ